MDGDGSHPNLHRVVVIRIVIADDQQMVREGFALIIDGQPDMELVAEAANGRDAVDACLRFHPDVCVLDIRMPRLDGISALKEIVAALGTNAPSVVMVTTFDLDEYVYEAFKAGARGFVTKDAGSQALLAAIRAAADGEGFASPDVTVRLIRHYAAADRRPIPQHITERERDLLISVASGLTNEELADLHHVSLSTVKSSLSKLMISLEARNRVELAIYAFRHGLMND
jgi:DNA-binding NarL/FixJ family response regulator